MYKTLEEKLIDLVASGFGLYKAVIVMDLTAARLYENLSFTPCIINTNRK